MPENNNHYVEQAEELLKRLRAVYCNYTEDCIAKRAAEGASGMFRGWLSGGSRTIEPLHEDFLKNVETLLFRLAEVLAEMGESEREMLAAEAARQVLTPVPGLKKTYKSESEWYMKAAEYNCCVLFPFLSKADLQNIHDNYVKASPKRMMFPKERELFEKMEAQLKLFG